MQGTWAWRPPHPGTWGPRTPELGKSCQGASKNHPVFPEPGEPGPFVPATCSEQGGCEGPAPSLLPSALGALLFETSSSPQQKASPQPLCLETWTYGVLHPRGSTSWSLPPPRITMHVVREHEGIRGVGACLLQQLLGHCNETHEAHAALSITTLLVPRGCVPSPTASSWSCSHRRCRRPAVASSCQAGTGPRRWPSQRPRCSFPFGDTSWRPSSRRPEPGTLQRHAVWISGHQHRAPALFLDVIWARTMSPPYRYGVPRRLGHRTQACPAGIVHNARSKWPGRILAGTAASARCSRTPS